MRPRRQQSIRGVLRGGRLQRADVLLQERQCRSQTETTSRTETNVSKYPCRHQRANNVVVIGVNVAAVVDSLNK